MKNLTIATATALLVACSGVSGASLTCFRSFVGPSSHTFTLDGGTWRGRISKVHPIYLCVSHDQRTGSPSLDSKWAEVTFEAPLQPGVVSTTYLDPQLPANMPCPGREDYIAIGKLQWDFGDTVKVITQVKMKDLSVTWSAMSEIVNLSALWVGSTDEGNGLSSARYSVGFVYPPIGKGEVQLDDVEVSVEVGQSMRTGIQSRTTGTEYLTGSTLTWRVKEANNENDGVSVVFDGNQPSTTTVDGKTPEVDITVAPHAKAGPVKRVIEATIMCP